MPTTMQPSQLKRIATPGFIAAFVALAVAAAGLQVTANYLKLHFQKLPVPLAKPLDQAIGAKLGPWVQVSKDEPLPKDTQEILATDKYIFRDFVDRRLVKAEVLDSFKDQTFKRRKEILAEVQAKNPLSVMSLAVTYYTGKADTVAHIPDRCYIADGYRPSEYDTVMWKVNPQPIEARFINFEDQTGRAQVTKSVAYFFKVNGVWTSSPERVRIELQDLFQRYGFYAKVELMTLIKNRQESARVMQDFLNNALPEIAAALPDWEQVKAGKWLAQGTTQDKETRGQADKETAIKPETRTREPETRTPESQTLNAKP